MTESLCPERYVITNYSSQGCHVFLLLFSITVAYSLQVNLNVKQGGKRLEHQGIRIEFVGQIGEPD